jgi:hypothetical protein
MDSRDFWDFRSISKYFREFQGVSVHYTTDQRVVIDFWKFSGFYSPSVFRKFLLISDGFQNF